MNNHKNVVMVDNLHALLDQLHAAIDPTRIIVDDEQLDVFSHDCWPVSILQAKRGQHLTRPDVIVQPISEEEILRILAIAVLHQIPLTPRGLGSSVTGQALPTQGGIVLDLVFLTDNPTLNELDLTVTVTAGWRGSDIEAWLNIRGYTLNFFPQSLARSSVGGWLATRATGQFSSRFGGIEDAITAYRVILSDGSVLDLTQKPRAAVGPDLRQLFLGSEGMFGVITQISLKVYPRSAVRISEAWVMPNVYAGVEVIREIYQAGIRPSLMRFYDEQESKHAVPELEVAGCVLFLSHEGLQSISKAEHAESTRIVQDYRGISLGSNSVDAWYQRRFDFSTVEKLLASKGGYAETIEVAHNWSGILPLYQTLIEALAPLADEVLGHFSHVYTQGTSLYVILLGRAPDDAEAARRLDEIWRISMETTTAAGGELSHHHGAGLARQSYIPQNLGSQHLLIRRVKDALDPSGILNPGHLGL